MIKRLIAIIMGIPVKGTLGKVNEHLFKECAKKYQVYYYRMLGLDMTGMPRYISTDVYFDSYDYRRIHIGDKVTVSREVMFLTHDFSINNAFMATSEISGGGLKILLKDIYVGDNSFIGARTSLLPGTTIGKDCVIGAGSVVKGKIPDGSVVIGNPARIIGKTSDYAMKHYEMNDYIRI